MRYNTSPLYSRAVYELAEFIRMGFNNALEQQGIAVSPQGRKP